MMRVLIGIAGVALVLVATPACAQAAMGSGAPANPAMAGGLVQNPTVRNGGDTTDRDLDRARDEAMARERQGTSAAHASRAVAAKPGDVAVGAGIRDSKGVELGTVESVSMASAVVATADGKVEVPLEAFGKDSKGLVFGMTKADFDAQVKAANAPH
jgi:hypothetical protein